ncbi:DUF5999 family protein [Streptomyces mayonensis]|uniref:DUF5999 family protein n=1 Tax=Streptomyces mayonensis TaxID=2750816 RepID=UPI001C1E4F40|nr:DUF5999 family protein [Streptomyces sp. A108]MBU6534612.1 hypothetical protein [Streptomyces sp. A108]
MCTHRSSCPATDSPAPADDSAAARVSASGFSAAGAVAVHLVAAHPEQGWNLLCDGTIVFDDTGELRPDGRVVAPRPAVGHPSAA